MIKLFYGMSEDLLSKYTQDKTDLIKARTIMTEENVLAAKKEIMQECRIFDIDIEESEELFSVKNGIATIPIQGMLVNKVDICSAFFGETVTTYRFIRAAIAQAEADPSVKKIKFDGNSGGGFVSGCEITFQAILNAKKPTVAVISDMAASGMYWLASACDDIISVSRTGFFGSIGVAVEMVNRDKQDDNSGIKRIILTNTSSKDKRPDMLTEDGQQIMIEELNALYDVFVESILIKRSAKLSRDTIDALGGRVIIAAEAVEMGLADRIMKPSEVESFLTSDFSINQSIPATGGNKITKDTKMTLSEFLESNPEAKAVYDKDIKAAKGAGIEEGQKATFEDALKADRERSAKILKLAGAAVPEKIAEAVKSGMTSGEFAEVELESQNTKRTDAKVQDTDLGKLGTDGQLPESGDDSDKGSSKAEKTIDAAVDKIVGKNKKTKEAE
ncbi:S49 family peptidase [Candidatus Pacearchaeota archaeon]|nr:S49 family peptidase [Candidatus Pacearchaeota archaeon]